MKLLVPTHHLGIFFLNSMKKVSLFQWLASLAKKKPQPPYVETAPVELASEPVASSSPQEIPPAPPEPAIDPSILDTVKFEPPPPEARGPVWHVFGAHRSPQVFGLAIHSCAHDSLSEALDCAAVVASKGFEVDVWLLPEKQGEAGDYHWKLRKQPAFGFRPWTGKRALGIG